MQTQQMWPSKNWPVENMHCAWCWLRINYSRLSDALQLSDHAKPLRQQLKLTQNKTLEMNNNVWLHSVNPWNYTFIITFFFLPIVQCISVQCFMVYQSLRNWDNRKFKRVEEGMFKFASWGDVAGMLDRRPASGLRFNIEKIWKGTSSVIKMNDSALDAIAQITH